MNPLNFPLAQPENDPPANAVGFVLPDPGDGAQPNTILKYEVTNSVTIAVGQNEEKASFDLPWQIVCAVSPVLREAVTKAMGQDDVDVKTVHFPHLKPVMFNYFVEWLHTKQIDWMRDKVLTGTVQQSWWLAVAKTYTLANQLQILELGNYLINLTSQLVTPQRTQRFEFPGRDAINEVYHNARPDGGLRKIMVAIEACTIPADLNANIHGWRTKVYCCPPEYLADYITRQQQCRYAVGGDPFNALNFIEQFYDRPPVAVPFNFTGN